MVDYKTIVSTTDSKVTLMQWLQALAKEFDNAKITDIAFANDGNSSLTFTFTLTDGTAKTATCKAITLTDDEKTIVSGLVGQVATSADGITFNKVVTFAGNIVTKGNEIHNGYASFLGDESHAGTEIHKGQSTFTDLRADDITATDGQDLLSYDGTNTSLKGKGTRPLYNASELALKSDIEPIVSLNDNLTELTVTRGTATVVKTAGNVYYSNNYLNIDYTLVVQDVTYGDYNQFQAKFYITLPSKTFINTALGRIVNVTGAMMKNDIGARRRIGNALVEFTQANSYTPVYMVAEISAATYDINDFQVNFYKDNSLTPSFPSGSPYIGTLHIRIPFAKEE